MKKVAIRRPGSCAPPQSMPHGRPERFERRPHRGWGTATCVATSNSEGTAQPRKRRGFSGCICFCSLLFVSGHLNVTASSGPTFYFLGYLFSRCILAAPHVSNLARKKPPANRTFSLGKVTGHRWKSPTSWPTRNGFRLHGPLRGNVLHFCLLWFRGKFSA